MAVLRVARLSGEHVVLEPMETDHADDIAAAATGDRSTFTLTHVPDGPEGARAYVAQLLEDAAAGRVAPFVQRRAADGVVVGCTRFMSPVWAFGRDDPDEVEIGGTWLAPAAQGTAVNTEAKLLLLTHAFAVWEVQRVAICTDERNARSRRAIEALGAVFEGVLRRHRASATAGERGVLRNSAMYSITIDDWPAVRDGLVRRLASRREDG